MSDVVRAAVQRLSDPRRSRPARPIPPARPDRARSAARIDPEREHGLADAEEPGDVGAGRVVAGRGVLLGRRRAGLVDAGHDVGESGFGVLEGPPVSCGVLLHLEGRCRDTAGVRRLAGPERDAGVAEHLDALGGGRHVRALDHQAAPVLDQGAGVVAVELVLGGRGDGQVAPDLPDVAAGHINRKLRTHTRLEAVTHAQRRGLIA